MACTSCPPSGAFIIPPAAARGLARQSVRHTRVVLARAVRFRAAGTELALIAVLYLAYSGVRMLARADEATALRHAGDVLHLETLTGLDVEAPLNHLVSGAPVVAVLASYWYAALHYTVTPAVLVLLWRRNRDRYRTARTALAIGSAIGLVGFLLVPTAPPRMLGGFVDTLTTTARYGWWSEHASAPRGLAGLTNEYAAMPSLHVGWALWVAWVAWTTWRTTTARVLGAAYATGTAVVVIGTGNHYLLDVLAGAAVVVVGIVVAEALARRRHRRELLGIGSSSEPAAVAAAGPAARDERVAAAA